MAGRSTSMRRTLAAALAFVALLSACASVALVLVPRALHRHTAAISAAFERHQLTEDAERDLLLRDRSRTDVVRARLAQDATTRLESVLASAAGERERSAAALALARSRAHVSDANDRPIGPEALEAIADLLQVQREELTAQRAQAERLHVLADVVGIASGMLVFAGTGVLLVLVNRRVLSPLGRLASRVRAFGRGDTSVRAEERGPREVAEMARAFNAMAETLVEQQTMHRTYLAGVAHDLRNPIHVLRAVVDLESSYGLEDAPPRTARLIGVLRRQLAQIERLVADLLDAESLREGRLELHVADNDLRDVATSVHGLFASTSERHPVILSVPARPVRVRCDAARIEQVLTNLVSNAIKYSPSGGEIAIGVSAAEERAVIEVVDHGMGMTEPQVAQAFRPFSRGADVKKSIPGHGLGLFIASRIVEEHGGAIHVDSTPGQGSTFRIELPRGEEAASHRIRRPPASAGDDFCHRCP